MKSHPFDPLSFVSGLVATAIGLLFLLPGTPGELIDRVGEAAEWFWPLLLIAVGVTVLLPLLRRSQSSDEEMEG